MSLVFPRQRQRPSYFISHSLYLGHIFLLLLLLPSLELLVFGIEFLDGRFNALGIIEGRYFTVE
jgi:hypothetical protein